MKIYQSIWNKFCRSSDSIALLALIFLMLTTSCKKFIDATPPSNIIAQTMVYADDATAISVLNGIYTDMSQPTTNAGFAGRFGISVLAGLSADELTYFNGVSIPSLEDHFENNLRSNSAGSSGTELWSALYSFIYRCNAAIEGLNNSTTLTEKIKKQLLAEAKFLRSFFYFYLTSLYGDVPLIDNTDYKIIPKLPKSPKEDVFDFIISNLIDARNNLSSDFLKENLTSTSVERIRPTIWSACALLARVYLYKGEYMNAIQEASQTISNPSTFALVPLNNAFLKNSKEAIWQLQPVTSFYNTEDGKCFIIPTTGFSASSPVYLSDTLINSFAPFDLRRVEGNWVNSRFINGKKYYYPYKYKIGSSNPSVTTPANMSEYQMILRFSEQLLIRAESYARLDQVGMALFDLNEVRRRAGLSPFFFNDKNETIQAILNERKFELFSEWGHRWLDMKRTNMVDSIMTGITPIKSGGLEWKNYKKLYPIPYSDITKSTQLSQNPGY